MEGRLDLLATGLLEALLQQAERKTQLNGLANLAMPALSSLTSQLGGIKIDPIVMQLGRFIVENMNQKRIS